ncbi:hypothetical protein KUCAC02_007203 [Chaenocephalus aceratus]|uniref:Uncharacterized protein n=1 Tax=Chaenocephalus aceratus TaxID=36190 RepID=A0ACB9X6D3_CHAAC|nr:hypothetical protein KUCAC02_007203 [Chaenocephalus aceratus]
MDTTPAKLREFTVMYQDMDFDGQFCTLSCIEDVEDKGTLTVFQTEPIVLNLSPVEVLDIDSSIAEQSSDNSSRHSSGPLDHPALFLWNILPVRTVAS